MVQFSSLFNGLAKSIVTKNGKKDKIDVEREAADALAKEARKNELMLSSPGIVHGEGSNGLASVFSKRGQKGMNQDCFVLWEAILKARVGRNVDGINHKLYYQSLKLLREFISGQISLWFLKMLEYHVQQLLFEARKWNENLVPSSFLC